MHYCLDSARPHHIVKTQAPLSPRGLPYAHNSEAQTPPPSRGRLGGGWGKNEACKISCLHGSTGCLPHPHPSPPLEGEGTGALHFMNIINILKICVHTVASRERGRGRGGENAPNPRQRSKQRILSRTPPHFMPNRPPEWKNRIYLCKIVMCVTFSWKLSE
jgi:hypothetical protein